MKGIPKTQFDKPLYMTRPAKTPTETMTVSSCCGADPTELCNEDTGFCPDCRDHTEFVDVCIECNDQECVCGLPCYAVELRHAETQAVVYEHCIRAKSVDDAIARAKRYIHVPVCSKVTRLDVTKWTDGTPVKTDSRGMIQI